MLKVARYFLIGIVSIMTIGFTANANANACLAGGAICSKDSQCCSGKCPHSIWSVSGSCTVPKVKEKAIHSH